jgi:hypothetical protein
MSDLRARIQRLQQRKQTAAQVNADRLVDVVELVNWVYAEQRAHLVDGHGIGLHEGERAAAGLRHNVRSAHAQFERILQLGCRIDRHGHDAGDLHPVAEAVNELVGSMLSARAMIINFASRGSIPDGFDFEMKLGPSWKVEAKYDAQGTPRPGSFHMAYDKNKHPAYCLLAYDHGPDYQRELRAEYVSWHDALSELVVLCCKHRARLGGLMVTGPKLLRGPWGRAEKTA